MDTQTQPINIGTLANTYAVAKSNCSTIGLIDLLKTLPVTPKDWQCELLVDILKDTKKYQDMGCDSVRKYIIAAAYGVGKTTFGAILTLAHFYEFGFKDFEAGYVGNIVSGSLTQLMTVTCAVLSEMLTSSDFKHYFTMTGNKIYMNANKNKFIRFCVCNTANIDSFAGIHKANGYVYNYFDEGTAIHDKAYEIANTFMDKGNCTWIVTGNPTTTRGEFYRKTQSPNWESKHISRYQFWGDDDPWSLSVKDEYGEDSDEYRKKVLGLFPLGASNNVFSLFICKDLQKKGYTYAYSHTDNYTCGPVVIGIDPSAQRVCDHGICVRDHIAVRELYPFNGDFLTLVRHAADYVDIYDVVAYEIDAIGCGWGLDTCLRAALDAKHPTKYKHIIINGVCVSNSPIYNKFCANRRAELVMEALQWSTSIGGVCPTDHIDRFFDELRQVTYEENSLNVKLSKKEGVNDLADSFFLTFAQPSLLATMAAQKSTNKIQQIIFNEYKKAINIRGN